MTDSNQDSDADSSVSSEEPPLPFFSSTQQLLLSTEADGNPWTYNNTGTDGAFRLVSVAELLETPSPRIVLFEFQDFRFPSENDIAIRRCDGLPDFCAISHVWQPSDDAARRSAAANQPLRVDLGNGEIHTISWLGLVQAATAAKYFDCQYIWLDLLCLDQTSHDDKMLQIHNMLNIYQSAKTVIVMIGGIHAAQSLHEPSSWVQRAWTFQEATVAPQQKTYLLVHRDLPDSWYSSRVYPGSKLRSLDGLYITKITDMIAILPFGPFVRLPAYAKFIKGYMETPSGLVDHDLKSDFACLGTDRATISSLSSALQFRAWYDAIDNERDWSVGSCNNKSDYESDADHDQSIENSGEDDNDEEFEDSDNSVSSSDDGQEPEGYESEEDSRDHEAENTLQSAVENIDSEADYQSENEPDQLSLQLDTRVLPIYPFGKEYGPDQSDAYYQRDAHDLKYRQDVKAQSTWRNIWQRTSTKPQDLVFSTMHVLGVKIKADYKRSLEDLLYELVAKCNIPGWLAVGYDLPVYPGSGLVPLPPAFTKNVIDAYKVNGNPDHMIHLLDPGIYCERFDLRVWSGNVPSDGHLACARFYEILDSGQILNDSRAPSFRVSKLKLVSERHEVTTNCWFKGALGSLVMIVGPAIKLTNTFQQGPGHGFGTPFVYILDKKSDGWHKTGVGFLQKRLFKSRSFLWNSCRTHLQVGGHKTTYTSMSPCDCKLSRFDKLVLENMKDQQVDKVSSNCDIAVRLYAAAYEREKREIRRLLQKGADVNGICGQTDEGIFYGTALHGAVTSTNARKDVVQLLLDAGADVNLNIGYYGTALQATAASACRTSLDVRHKLEVLALLLRAGADPNIQGGQYGAALHAAIQFGNDKIARELVRAGANLHVEKKYRKGLQRVLGGMSWGRAR